MAYWHRLGLASVLLMLMACNSGEQATVESPTRADLLSSNKDGAQTHHEDAAVSESPEPNPPNQPNPPEAAVLLSESLTVSADEASQEKQLSKSEPVESDTAEAKPEHVLRIGSTVNLEGSDLEDLIKQWLTHVFAELDYNVQLEFVPGRRMIIELNRGIMDVDLVRSVDISRGFDNILRVDYPWITSCILVIGLEGAYEDYVADKSMGTEKVVGLTSGSPSLSNLVERQWPDSLMTEYKTDRQAVMLLQHQRVDFVVAPHVNWQHLRKISQRPLRVYGVLAELQGYMHLHKKHAALAPGIIKSMQKHAAESAGFSCDAQHFQRQQQQPPVKP